MKRFVQSRWLRLLGVMVSLFALYFTLKTFQGEGTLIVSDDDPITGAHISFSSDTAVIAFPGDCFNVSWQVEGIRTVFLDEQPTVGTGTKHLCYSPWSKSPNLQIEFQNGTTKNYNLRPTILSLEPTTWLFPGLGILGLLIAIQPFQHLTPTHRRTVRVFVGISILMALFTVFDQVNVTSFNSVLDLQFSRHNDVLEGKTEYNQWQYRVLSEFAVEGAIRLGERIGIGYATIFILFRIAQNVAIFLLASRYYHVLGMNQYLILLGLVMIFWSMTRALYNSDLQFNTYFDIIFYLIAAMLIARRRFFWLIPLMLVAALNRETSGFIPLMLIGSELRLRPIRVERKVILVSIASIAVYISIEVLLRQIYGWRPGEGIGKNAIGWPMLAYNVTRENTWRYLFETLNLIPFIAVYQLRNTSLMLRRFFWVLVPIWFVIHFVSALVAETRLFLVPFIVILLPIVLLSIPQSSADAGGLTR